MRQVAARHPHRRRRQRACRAATGDGHEHDERERQPERRPSWLEPVADAPHGHQMRGLGGIVLDLLAQPADVDRDRGGVAVPGEVPDRLEQRRPA